MSSEIVASLLTRREVLARLGRASIAFPAAFLFSAQSCGGGSSKANLPQPPSLEPTDDQFLDSLGQACFSYFWNEAAPTTGQVKDRAKADGSGKETVSSTAATGFGLTALCIADSRGYKPTLEIQQRVRATLQFLLNTVEQVNGFFYHFVDMNSGARAFGSEVSSIDTALLLGGVLTVRQHFSSDSSITSLATQIYERVNWPWMQNGGATLCMGWTPEKGFLSARWDTYCELMMMYLLGIGSTTHPLSPAVWDSFRRPQFQYGSFKYINNSYAPLFVHQYSHAWFDFRNKRDSYANYFQNSVVATQAHKAFCLSLAGRYKDYSENLWGITASDSAKGYTVWGGPPEMGQIDGTIVPCAAAGSLPFLSAECISVLRNIKKSYPNTWSRYGFVDAFNPLTGWYGGDVLGIDVGISMLMAENQRSQFVWNTFMKNPEPKVALDAVGFTAG